MELEESIRIWKEQYGDLFSVEYEVGSFILRSLTIGEYVKYITDEQTNSADAEEVIVKTALLYPLDLDYDNAPAGLISALAQELVTLSGFNDPITSQQVLDDYRAESARLDNSMKSVILAAMPAYKEEDLDKLNFSDLCHKVVLAEQILAIQAMVAAGEAIGFDIPDPEKIAEEEEKQKQSYIRNRREGQALPDDPIAQRLRMAM